MTYLNNDSLIRSRFISILAQAYLSVYLLLILILSLLLIKILL